MEKEGKLKEEVEREREGRRKEDKEKGHFI